MKSKITKHKTLKNQKPFFVIDGYYLQKAFKLRKKEMDHSIKGLSLFIEFIEKLTHSDSFNYIYYCSAAKNIMKPLEGQNFKNNCQELQINVDIKPMKTMKYKCCKCKHNGSRPQ